MGGRGGRGRVAIGADSRVLRPRGGRLAARRERRGRANQAKGERKRAGARERDRQRRRKKEECA